MKQLMWHFSGALVVLALTAGSGEVAAQTGETTDFVTSALRVAHVEQGPVVDGLADDPVWQMAQPLDDFHVFAPTEGGIPSQRTEVKAVVDDAALYVLVRAYDSQPDSIVRRLGRRDSHGLPNDQIQLFIDPYHDRRNGFEYIVTAGGVLSDYLLFDDTGWDLSWDGVWQAEVSVDSEGWLAEFAIPLQQLGFSGGGVPTFGFMVWRVIGRSGERVSWPGYRASNAGLVSQSGPMRFESSLSTGIGLEATPYVSGRSPVGSLASDTRVHEAVGTDLRFAPRPNVDFRATINPDFGQVESDPALLNLTAFEVQHPEKRRFFLEDAGALAFPLAEGTGSQLFYSRRLGERPALGAMASDAPEETTILGALRGTVRPSPGLSISVLSAVTDRERADGGGGAPAVVVEPRAHYGAVNIKQTFREGRSGISMMMTRMDRSVSDSLVNEMLPHSAMTAGVALRHESASRNYRMAATTAATDIRGSELSVSRLQVSPVHAYQRPDAGAVYDPSRTSLAGTFVNLDLGKVGGGVSRFGASYRRIGDGFDVNEMGYIPQAGMQFGSLKAGLESNRPGKLLGVDYRSAGASATLEGGWTTDGLPHKRGLTLAGDFELPSQWQLVGSFYAELPGAYCTIGCTRGGPALRNDPQQALTLGITGDSRASVVPSAKIVLRKDDGGRSTSTESEASLTWRPKSNLEATFGGTYNDTDYAWFFYRRFGDPVSDTAVYTLAALDLSTASFTARLDYTVTRDLSLQWYGQAYLSKGTYSDVRELANPRHRNYEERFAPYSDESVRQDPGGIDFGEIRQNAVLRWEYRPASTVYLVWSHGWFRDSTTPGDLRWFRDVGDLLSQPSRGTIAVKVSYWLTR